LALGVKGVDGTHDRAEREEVHHVIATLRAYPSVNLPQFAAHAPMYRPLAIRYSDEKERRRPTANGGFLCDGRWAVSDGGEVPVFGYRLIQRARPVGDLRRGDSTGASLIDNYKTLFSRVIVDVVLSRRSWRSCGHDRRNGAATADPRDERPLERRWPRPRRPLPNRRSRPRPRRCRRPRPAVDDRYDGIARQQDSKFACRRLRARRPAVRARSSRADTRSRASPAPVTSAPNSELPRWSPTSGRASNAEKPPDTLGGQA